MKVNFKRKLLIALIIIVHTVLGILLLSIGYTLKEGEEKCSISIII